MISPLISPLFYQQSGLILHLSLQGRQVDFGIASGIFFLMLFLGAPIIGSLSDHYGRKKLLLTCLLGSIFGYLLAIIAIYTHHLSIFILGRVIDGFTAGTLALAQAAVADCAEGNDKTKYIGYVFTALTLGFLIGPVLSGYLGQFSIYLPFIAVILLAVINLWLFATFFKETVTVKATKRPSLSPFNKLSHIFSKKSLALLFLLFFILQQGWSYYIFIVPIYLTNKFHYNTVQVGIFLTVISAGFLLATSYINPYISKRCRIKSIIVIAFLILAILIFADNIFASSIISWITAIPLAITLALIYTSITTLISDQSPKDKQGLVMGNASSIGSLAFAIGATSGGWLSAINIALPFYLTAIFSFIGFIIAIFAIKQQVPDTMT